MKRPSMKIILFLELSRGINFRAISLGARGQRCLRVPVCRVSEVTGPRLRVRQCDAPDHGTDIGVRSQAGAVTYMSEGRVRLRDLPMWRRERRPAHTPAASSRPTALNHSRILSRPPYHNARPATSRRHHDSPFPIRTRRAPLRLPASASRTTGESLRGASDFRGSQLHAANAGTCV